MVCGLSAASDVVVSLVDENPPSKGNNMEFAIFHSTGILSKTQVASHIFIRKFLVQMQPCTPSAASPICLDSSNLAVNDDCVVLNSQLWTSFVKYANGFDGEMLQLSFYVRNGSQTPAELELLPSDSFFNPPEWQVPITGAEAKTISASNIADLSMTSGQASDTHSPRCLHFLFQGFNLQFSTTVTTHLNDNPTSSYTPGLAVPFNSAPQDVSLLLLSCFVFVSC